MRGISELCYNRVIVGLVEYLISFTCDSSNLQLAMDLRVDKAIICHLFMLFSFKRQRHLSISEHERSGLGLKKLSVMSFQKRAPFFSPGLTLCCILIFKKS